MSCVPRLKSFDFLGLFLELLFFLSIQEFCSFEVEFEGRFGGFVVGVQYGGGSRTRSCPVFGGCRGVVGVLFFLDGIGSGGERLAVGGHQLAE